MLLLKLFIFYLSFKVNFLKFSLIKSLLFILNLNCKITLRELNLFTFNSLTLRGINLFTFNSLSLRGINLFTFNNLTSVLMVILK